MIDATTGEVKNISIELALALMPRREGDQLALNKALFKAQGMFKILPKNGTIEKTYQDKNTKEWKKFKIKYAQIEDVFPAAVETLQQCGIYIQQEPFPCLIDGNLYVMTSLIHVGTEEEEGTGASKSYFYPVCSLQGLNQQDAAGANTSAKRLAVIEGLFLVAEEDKSGDTSKARTTGGQQQEPKAPYKPVEKAPAKKPVPKEEPKAVEAAPDTVDPAPPADPDKELVKRLWKQSLSSDLTLESVNAATMEAGKLSDEKAKKTIQGILGIRNILLRTVDERETTAAREVMKQIPERTLLAPTSKDGPTVKGFLEGLIVAKETEIKGKVK